MMGREFLRYLLVGGSAFLLDFTTLYALTEYAGLYYLAAACIAFSVGVAYTYALSIAWVFNHRARENRLHEFGLFVGIGLVGMAINAIVMWGLTEAAGYYYLTSKIVAAGIVFVFNFSVRRTLLFTPSYDRRPA
jgi:putative flippase GtrA